MMNLLYDAKYMRQNVAYMNNCAEYTMICIHCVVRSTILENKQRTGKKNNKSGEILRGENREQNKFDKTLPKFNNEQ